MSKRSTIELDDSNLTLEVVGVRPTHTPYVRIADPAGDMVASLNESQMRRLVTLMTRALGRD